MLSLLHWLAQVDNACLRAVNSFQPTYLFYFTIVGSAIGYYLSTKIGPTELPQAVAAFHSLVGLAAAFTAVGDFMVHDIIAHPPSAFHSISTYLGKPALSRRTTFCLVCQIFDST